MQAVLFGTACKILIEKGDFVETARIPKENFFHGKGPKRKEMTEMAL